MSIQKLRWGILGCASIAKRSVIPGIRLSEHNEVKAIASRSIETAQATAEELHIPMAYGSYEEMLADPQLDVIYIPLPNHLHKEWSIKAARAGKHVLCEKPIALNSIEAAEMAQVAREENVIIAEAFMYRYHPRYKLIKQMIADGEIGEIRHIRGGFTFNNGDSIDNVRYVKEWGGGSLYDVGCYPISAARYILEREPIATTMQAMFSQKHGGVDMMASGLLEFSDDVALAFDCGMWAAPRSPLEIIGTDGVIELPNAFLSHTEEGSYFYVRKGDEVREIKTPYYNSYALQADALARTIRGEEQQLFPLEDAVANMKALEACLKSAETGARIIIN